GVPQVGAFGTGGEEGLAAIRVGRAAQTNNIGTGYLRSQAGQMPQPRFQGKPEEVAGGAKVR
ncbi:MAG TPA: hypothetical protein PLF37_16920, partial [Planctomycetota bacterium]|nr:hypothetical protein [Planctomycetota bacterium]